MGAAGANGKGEIVITSVSSEFAPASLWKTLFSRKAAFPCANFCPFPCENDDPPFCMSVPTVGLDGRYRRSVPTVVSRQSSPDESFQPFRTLFVSSLQAKNMIFKIAFQTVFFLGAATQLSAQRGEGWTSLSGGTPESERAQHLELFIQILSSAWPPALRQLEGLLLRNHCFDCCCFVSFTCPDPPRTKYHPELILEESLFAELKVLLKVIKG